MFCSGLLALGNLISIIVPLPNFDFRDIRPKGARLITAGGKAPGPEPLKECLFQIQKIFDRKQNGNKLNSAVQ